MNAQFVTTETLNELFAKLRFQPNTKALLKVREIINNDLQSDADYPDDAAKEIVNFLEIDFDYLPDIIEVLKPLYLQDNKDFNFYPDNH